jgi:hypothetical protein
MSQQDFEDHCALQKALVVEAERIREVTGTDTVFISTTYVDKNGSTARISGGVGNWYARMGCLREILDEDAERTRCRTRRSEEEAEEE